MPERARDVETYLANVKERDRDCLLRLRTLCRATLKGYDESIQFGMPGYSRGGVLEIAFASQAKYISLYVLKTEVVAANRAALSGLSVGKGCIRFASPKKVDFAVVKKLLEDTRKSAQAICERP